jgi:hypothetical protein
MLTSTPLQRNNAEVHFMQRVDRLIGKMMLFCCGHESFQARS